MSRIDDARAPHGRGPIGKACTQYGVRWAHEFAKDPFVTFVSVVVLIVAAFLAGAVLSGILAWWWLS